MSTTQWRILTSGPCPKFMGTTEEAMAYVEQHAPLKRGWTGQWESVAQGLYYRRYNSKGRLMTNYSVSLIPSGQMGVSA